MLQGSPEYSDSDGLVLPASRTVRRVRSTASHASNISSRVDLLKSQQNCCRLLVANRAVSGGAAPKLARARPAEARATKYQNQSQLSWGSIDNSTNSDRMFSSLRSTANSDQLCTKATCCSVHIAL